MDLTTPVLVLLILLAVNATVAVMLLRELVRLRREYPNKRRRP